MPQSLNIEIKTLTPLWTGGVDGTCDRLHISGLVGSLRYWYEAIVRGVGGYACDPSQGGCVYKPLDKEHPETTGLKSICAACYLFGTTGWARMFRLSLNGEPPRVDKDKGIFAGQSFRLRLLFRPYASEMYSQAEYAKEQMKALLWFIQRYAGLGTRLQKKFGLVDINVISEEWADFQSALEDVGGYKGKEGVNHSQWPALNHFFSYEFEGVDKPATVPMPRSRQKSGKSTQENPLKNSALRTWLENRLSYHTSPTTEEDPMDIMFGRKSEDNNKKRSSRFCITNLKQASPTKYVVHLYGFGVVGLLIKEQLLDGPNLSQLVEIYIEERWPLAKLVQKWNANIARKGFQA